MRHDPPLRPLPPIRAVADHCTPVCAIPAGETATVIDVDPDNKDLLVSRRGLLAITSAPAADPYSGKEVIHQMEFRKV